MTRPIVSVITRSSHSSAGPKSRKKPAGRLDRIKSYVQKTPRRQTAAVFLTAAILFGLLSWFYMGPALSSCSQGILGGGPGDGTAGLTWLSWIDKNHILPGFTHLTNAPFGESLRQPFQITSVFSISGMWILTQLTSAVCAWNLMVFLGYMSSALLMFAFIRWLTRNSFAAFVAGFAVTFTPYHQLNALGHLSYMFSGLFVLVIWAFLVFWRTPSIRNALLLALASAACIYLDGYFILLAGILVTSLFIGGIVYEYLAAKESAEKLKLPLKAAGIYVAALIIFIMPVIYVQLHSGAYISKSLSSSRDSISNEAEVYSARPLEYLLPADNDPLLPSAFRSFRVREIHGSNFTESTIYLGASVIALAAAGYVLVFRRKQPQLQRIDPRFIAIVMAAGIVIAFLISLPPKAPVHLLGHPVPLPSWFIIHFVKLWRVFARLSLIVDVCLVVMAAIGYFFIVRSWTFKRQLVTTAVVTVVILADFMTQSRAAVWHYSESPGVYAWLSHQAEVKTVAEYPLGEPPSQAISDYLTYQQIDGKARLNTSRSDSPERSLHLSLEGLADPQTVPALRALGVNLVLEHRLKAPAIDGLQLIRTDSSHYNDDEVWTYKILPGTVLDYALVADQGFHAPAVDAGLHSRIGMGTHGIMALRQLGGKGLSQVNVRFLADSAAPGVVLSIKQGGVIKWQGPIGQATLVQFTADSKKPIDLLPGSKANETIQVYDLQAL